MDEEHAAGEEQPPEPSPAEQSAPTHSESAKPTAESSTQRAIADVETAAQDVLQRAEQMLDRFGRRLARAAASVEGQSAEHTEVELHQVGARVGGVASEIGFQALQALARIREEAEDIWAEAQHIRHGNQPPDAGDSAT